MHPALSTTHHWWQQMWQQAIGSHTHSNTQAEWRFCLRKADRAWHANQPLPRREEATLLGNWWQIQIQWDYIITYSYLTNLPWKRVLLDSVSPFVPTTIILTLKVSTKMSIFGRVHKFIRCHERILTWLGQFWTFSELVPLSTSLHHRVS